MANAYTPGLTVSGDTVVRRVRRLPIKGEVLVRAGDAVEPDQSVARALLPGPLQTVKLAERLGIEAREAPGMLQVPVGSEVRKGDVLAQTKGVFGLFKNAVTSDFAGSIESVSEVTGNVLVREPAIPVEVKAYIHGRVAEVLPNEGAVVETRAAFVQGIFGVGGERLGAIRIAASGPDHRLEAADVQPGDSGKILVGGAGVSYDAIAKAAEVGAVGIVSGGIRDADLVRFLGYDIGVAITGQEPVPLSLVVTEGFGALSMAERTFELLRRLEGRQASLNGATQIRAGVVRPEVIVPLTDADARPPEGSATFELAPGTAIRIIREPYFGRLATVVELPTRLVTLDSGTEVRVLRARIDSDEVVTVPRANVEIIAC